MKIKVCGMKEPSNIIEVVNLGIDYIGFIFYEKSPRFVQDDFLLPKDLTINALKTKKVGVFVNHSLETIIEKIIKYRLDLVQLHGSETAEFCHHLRIRLASLDSFMSQVEIIKVFSIGESFDFKQLEAYKSCINYFLFDTKGTNLGGNGVTFDWNILKSYKHEVPFFLSGGIDVQHVPEIKQLSSLPIHALDINSRFEVSAGFKNIEKIKKFKQLLL
jgi:phosphoribosylanthranilate isomerase